jgi:hypothetical protein
MQGPRLLRATRFRLAGDDHVVVSYPADRARPEPRMFPPIREPSTLVAERRSLGADGVSRGARRGARPHKVPNQRI